MTDQVDNTNSAGGSRLRLQTIVRLRWIAVTGQFVTVVGVHWGLGFKLPILICLSVIAMSAGLNVYLRLSHRPRRRVTLAYGTGLLAYDIIQLAALLYLTGGLENPFTFLIIAPVTVSAATLPARNTIFLGILTLTATTVLMSYHLPLPWMAGEQLQLPFVYKIGMWASVFCCLVFIGLYAQRLAKETRQMTEALAATEFVLSREQQLHALDGLAAAAAHELGTPLSTITVVAKELVREIPPGTPHGDDVELIRSQAQRCREILETLTNRFNQEDPLHTRLPLTHLIEEAAEPFRVFEKIIEINAAADPDTRSYAAAEPVARRTPGLVHGLTNIIENAVDFAVEKVSVDAKWDGRIVAITITDDGPGFAPHLIDMLGEPFLTTRPANQRDSSNNDDASGMGLGYFIAKTLLERSGAEIELSNKPAPAQGAVVKISWPRDRFEQPPVEW